MAEHLKNIIQLKNDYRGVTAIEYAIIAATVFVVLISAMTFLGPQLAATFGPITTALTPQEASEED
jgi:Flp pilus assembly pilin Flp